MSLLPANWREDLQIKEDAVMILAYAVQQNGGRIHIPAGEIITLIEEEGKDLKLTISADGEGGWLVTTQPYPTREEENLLPFVTYINKGVDYFGPENEATDKA